MSFAPLKTFKPWGSFSSLMVQVTENMAHRSVKGEFVLAEHLGQETGLRSLALPSKDLFARTQSAAGQREPQPMPALLSLWPGLPAGWAVPGQTPPGTAPRL